MTTNILEPTTWPNDIPLCVHDVLDKWSNQETTLSRARQSFAKLVNAVPQHRLAQLHFYPSDFVYKDAFARLYLFSTTETESFINLLCNCAQDHGVIYSHHISDQSGTFIHFNSSFLEYECRYEKLSSYQLKDVHTLIDLWNADQSSQ